jgi:hypothetical protein
MPAELIEAMFVASIDSLLPDHQRPQHEKDDDAGTVAATPDVSPAERQGVIDAVLTGDENRLGATLGALIDRRAPEVAMLRLTATSHRHSRELESVRALERWAEQEQFGRTELTRKEARALNRTMRSWYSTVTITMDDQGVTIAALPRTADGESDLTSRRAVHVGLQDWMRRTPPPRSLRPRPWKDSEILGALQAWADTNGRSPRPGEWIKAAPDHPTAKTVRKQFCTWALALDQADLTPAPRTYARAAMRVP